MDQLTELTLLEVLASLPMEQVVRLMQVGSPRLRRLCSRKWVTDRMTNVDFYSACLAHHAGEDVLETFSKEAVLRRLYGDVRIDLFCLNDPTYFQACMFIAKKVPGRLLLGIHNLERCFPHYSVDLDWRVTKRLKILEELIVRTDRLFYILVLNLCVTHLDLRRFPKVIMTFVSDMCCNRVLMEYRPALLNGRHFDDLLTPAFKFGRITWSGSEQNSVKDMLRNSATAVTEDIWRVTLHSQIQLPPNEASANELLI